MQALQEKLTLALRDMSYDFFDLMEDRGRMAPVMDSLPEVPSGSDRFVARLSHILRDSANDNREAADNSPRRAA